MTVMMFVYAKGIYIYIWFGHASDYAYGYSTWKVAQRCRGLWSGSLSLYLKFSHQDLVDQWLALSYLRMKHRFYTDIKCTKSVLYGFTQMMFFFFFLPFQNIERETFTKNDEFVKKNTQSKGREREREKNVRPYFMRDGYSKMKHGYKYE